MRTLIRRANSFSGVDQCTAYPFCHLSLSLSLCSVAALLVRRPALHALHALRLSLGCLLRIIHGELWSSGRDSARSRAMFLVIFNFPARAFLRRRIFETSLAIVNQTARKTSRHISGLTAKERERERERESIGSRIMPRNSKLSAVVNPGINCTFELWIFRAADVRSITPPAAL